MINEEVKFEFYVDNAFLVTIMKSMKWQTVIVLLAIALSIVVPPSFPLATANDERTSIGTLDVCHSATPALSSNGEMPVMTECPCRLLPSAFHDILDIMDPICKPVLIVFQDEIPPKA